MDEIILIDRPVSKVELKQIAIMRFGDMVKAVIDLETQQMAVGGGLYADEEAYLLERGSKQENLWGVNIYPDMELPDMVEFDSMINIRPRQNNRSRGVEDEKIRRQIIEIIKLLII